MMEKCDFCGKPLEDDSGSGGGVINIQGCYKHPESQGGDWFYLHRQAILCIECFFKEFLRIDNCKGGKLMTKYNEFKFNDNVKMSENLEKLAAFLKDHDSRFDFSQVVDYTGYLTYSGGNGCPDMWFELSVVYQMTRFMFELKPLTHKTGIDCYRFDEVRIPIDWQYHLEQGSDLCLLLCDGDVVNEVWMKPGD